MNRIVCPGCQKGSLEIKASMELPPFDGQSLSCQLVQCPSCEKSGVVWYEVDCADDCWSWHHQGYSLPREAWDKLSTCLDLCPDKTNNRCQCETHIWLSKTVKLLGMRVKGGDNQPDLFTRELFAHLKLPGQKSWWKR